MKEDIFKFWKRASKNWRIWNQRKGNMSSESKGHLSLLKQIAKGIMVEQVLDHWYTNLMLAHAGLLEVEDIDSGECAFCIEFDAHSCKKCPIVLYTKHTCGNANWIKISCDLIDEVPKEKILEDVEAFVGVLEMVCYKWLRDRKR